MAEEKTEKATPKKRRDERKEGNVFSSKDVIAVVSLLGSFYVLKFFFPTIYRVMSGSITEFISSIAEINDLSMGTLQQIGRSAVKIVAECTLPVGIVIIALSVIASGVQTRFIFVAKSAAFKLSNLSILKGIKNMFSMKNVIELLKAALKIVILCYVLYGILKDEMINVAQMMDMSPVSSSVFILNEVMSMVIKISLIFGAIAGFDYFYQRWSYEKKIKMTKQEIKEEFKQTEGNPEIKGKIRNLQRSMAKNRMMQAVPDADVIIRNPTHFAVALKYDIDHDNAPILVAKGQDLLALKIIEIGQQSGVAIVENRPLARGIYASTPLEGEIPAEYYGVVAEILVQVFRMNKKME